MEKQTAVMKLLQYILVDCRNNGVIQFSAHETFNEYLEMEKEQMKDAWDDGLFGKTDNFKQYYNETFGKL